MTNDERDALIAQGWTPPVAVDPDLIEARAIVNQNIYKNVEAMALDAIKRGRALATAEAKPGMVWKEYKGCAKPPVPLKSHVCVRYCNMDEYDASTAEQIDWFPVTHYAIITPPEDK